MLHYLELILHSLIILGVVAPIAIYLNRYSHYQKEAKKENDHDQ